MKHNTAILPDGRPEYSVENQRGKKARRWAWAYDPDGPQRIDAHSDNPPHYVESQVKLWWQGIRAIQEQVPDPDDSSFKAHKGRCSALLRLARKDLINCRSDVRKEYAREAAEMHRLGSAIELPPELCAIYLYTAAKLFDALKQSAPAKSTKEHPAPKEALEQQWPAALERICRECKIPDPQKKDIMEIRAFQKAALMRAGPSAMDYEANSGRAPWDYEHPEDELPEDLMPHLQWRMKLQNWPWWYDPGLPKAKPDNALLASYRAAASITYWDVTRALIFYLAAPVDVEAVFNLPSGRCRFILPRAMAQYRR